MRILVFGDSIAQGFWDMSGGWVQRFGSKVHQASLDNMLHGDGKSYIEVFNLGISGDTSEGVLNRLKQEVEARRTDEYSEVIILAIGINDSILKADHKVLMDVYQFQEKYEKIIKLGQDISDQVFCLGLTAVDEEQTSPWKYSSTGKQWRNNRINLFEDAIKQSCSRLSVPFIPIHDEFLSRLKNGQNLLADGLHPNELGHQFIADIVSEHVTKKQ
jgi:lysophospholipase L1-like esterase